MSHKITKEDLEEFTEIETTLAGCFGKEHKKLDFVYYVKTNKHFYIVYKDKKVVYKTDKVDDAIQMYNSL